MKKMCTVRDWIVKNLDDAFARQSKCYNLRRREFHYKIGDLVLARSRKLSSKEKNIAAKLCPPFSGP